MALEIQRWDDVRLFLQAARRGSFSAAAKAEGIEQSTMSRRIASLEENLGHPVFLRHRTGLTLTDLGRRLVRRAEQAEAELWGFADEAKGEERDVAGDVRLALTESMAVHVVVPFVVPILRERFPGIRLDLKTGYRNVDLGLREADLALRFARPSEPSLVMKRLARMETAVLASATYAKGRSKRDIEWIRLGMSDVPAPESDWYDAHIGEPPTLSTSGYLTQVAMVRQGLGAAVLTRSLLRIDEGLVVLDLGFPKTPPIDLWLVCHAGRRRIPRVSAVWALLEEALVGL
ncbi:MAG: LysR family transcriptional regulator [Polyangiales bacterium]